MENHGCASPRAARERRHFRDPQPPSLRTRCPIPSADTEARARDTTRAARDTEARVRDTTTTVRGIPRAAPRVTRGLRLRADGGARERYFFIAA